MKISIIGCGISAKGWFKVPCDLSIGVNDMLKFGHQPDQLVLINFERKFTHDRLKTILATKAKRVWTHTSTWKRHFPHADVIKLTQFNGNVRNDLIYSSKTSPMVAISLAVKQGASEIIIWGVDMINHPAYRKATKHGDYEINQYLKFFQQLNKRGIKVYRGADNTAFDFVLPLYQKEEVAV
jgi:hypothetical protein